MRPPRQLIAHLALLLLASATATAAPRSDEFLAGYVSAILEHELKLPSSSYTLRVEGGVVAVQLATDAAPSAAISSTDAVRERLQQVPDLNGVKVSLAESATTPTTSTGFWRGIGKSVGRVLGVSGETESFPRDDVFLPLLADEKQPQFNVSLRHYNTPQGNTTVGAVAYGETFGLLRIRGRNDTELEGLQFSVAGALFAQFDLEAASSDLINADYSIGVQTTYRRSATSARLRIYHQSSHLGDEFLLRVNPERVNLSFESFEALIAQQWSNDRWRAYGGFEYMLRREPDELKPAMVHAGLEYRGTTQLWLGSRFVAGLDLKSYQENDWDIDTALRAGLQFGGTRPGRRSLRVLGEAYRGANPHGQFILRGQTIDYVGIGLYLGL